MALPRPSRLLLSFLPVKEAAITQANSQAAGIPSNSLAIALLPLSKGSSIPQANSQAMVPTNSLAIAHLPAGEGNNSPLATAHLPSEDSSSSQAIAHLPSREGSNPSQATALLPPNEGSSTPQASSSSQVGQVNNPTRSVRQGHRHSPRHRAPQSSQENSTISQEDNPTSTPQ